MGVRMPVWRKRAHCGHEECPLGLRRSAVAWLGLGLVAAASPVAALTIELDDVAPDRVERQRAFAEGRLPLPGTPSLGDLPARLDEKGLKAGDHVFIRIFKASSELEVWMRRGDRFVLFASYPMCHWSGTLGPKLREGDKQNPEGFYAVTSRQLHRIGRWPRSLNIGFPNAFDRTLGRTGSYILVHGGCSSTGCFAMTNAVIDEIYDLTEAALRKGQERVQVHVFPFRMTEANLARYGASEWHDFWLNLKDGYDAFEATQLPPRIGYCEQKYVVSAAGPQEVGDPGPLAMCGGLSAATATPSPQATTSASQIPLVASSPQSRHQAPATMGRLPSPPALSPPSPALLQPPDPPGSSLHPTPPSPGMLPASPASASPASTPSATTMPTAAPGRPVRSVDARPAIPIRCNLARPGCRKWSSLAQARAARPPARERVAASARSRHLRVAHTR